MIVRRGFALVEIDRRAGAERAGAAHASSSHPTSSAAILPLPLAQPMPWRRWRLGFKAGAARPRGCALHPYRNRMPGPDSSSQVAPQAVALVVADDGSGKNEGRV